MTTTTSHQNTTRLLAFQGLLCLALWGMAGTVWALPHPYFSKHPKQAKQLEALLQKTSLKVLEPQPADLGISLSDLKGQDHSLSRYRGHVMMLTRWATWCGACKAELPFKRKLKQQLASDRFALIGISSEDQDTVASYEKDTDNRFPTSLLDAKGLMQKFFPGGAIPVTIIIDPWGWVMAMKTGGDRWDGPQYQALFRFLIALAPSKEALKKREKAPAPKVSYAKQIKVKAGQVFAVAFGLRWFGERDKYTRLLFRLPKEKGLRVLGVATSGIQASDKGGNQRKYILRLKVEKPGDYKLHPLLLTYWIKDYDGHFQVPIGEMEIKAAGLLGTPGRKFPTWALGTLGAAAFLILLAIVAIRRRKPQDETASEQADAQQKERVDAIVKALLRAHNDEAWGDFLTTARQLWREGLKDKDPELNELEEAFRYGGQRPNRDQIAAVVQRLYQTMRGVYPNHAARLKELR